MRKERQNKIAYLIPQRIVHERMLYDCIETGLGLKHTTLLINKELKRDGLIDWCFMSKGILLAPQTGYHRNQEYTYWYQ